MSAYNDKLKHTAAILKAQVRIKEAEKLLSAIAGEMSPSLKKNLKEMAHLTDINNHSEAIELLAKLSGDKAVHEAAKAVVALHDFFGSIPSELYELRKEVRKRAMARFEEKHGIFHAREFAKYV